MFLNVLLKIEVTKLTEICYILYKYRLLSLKLFLYHAIFLIFFFFSKRCTHRFFREILSLFFFCYLKTQVIGYRLQFPDCRLHVAGCSLQAAQTSKRLSIYLFSQSRWTSNCDFFEGSTSFLCDNCNVSKVSKMAKKMTKNDFNLQKPLTSIILSVWKT